MLAVMFYSLLPSLNKCNFYFNVDGEEGEQMLKFIFLAVQFDIKEGECQDSKCPNSYVQGCWSNLAVMVL